MIACEECGKKLGFLEGYYHPTLGKKSLVCSPCFVKAEESVAQWRDFILSNSFNPEASEATVKTHWSSLFTGISGVQKAVEHNRIKKEFPYSP